MAVRIQRSATLTLNTQNQKIEQIQALMKRLGGLAGCEMCGRMALLHIDFLQDPPPPDLAKEGVTGFLHE